MLEFSDLLKIEGFDPARVRLLRHHRESGTTPYVGWLTNRPAFELWQTHQKQNLRPEFADPHWASFVSTPDGGTMFVGLYAAQIVGPSDPKTPDALGGRPENDQSKIESGRAQYDDYELILLTQLSDLAGRLFIDWPKGRNWKRRGNGVGFGVKEIRQADAEPPYPGHSAFLEPLSSISALPPTWQAILREAKGVYVITCPRDKSHYVGKADGENGFFGRWLSHASLGGDAIGFRRREASEYTVSILEVAGSFATARDIGNMEQRWMQKLQSRAIGIN
jgi:hypothetical protein